MSGAQVAVVVVVVIAVAVAVAVGIAVGVGIGVRVGLRLGGVVLFAGSAGSDKEEGMGNEENA